MLSFLKPRLARISSLVHSIRFRLAFWFVVILAFVLVIFSAFIYTRQRQDLQTAAARRLELKAQRLGRFLSFESEEFFNRTPLSIPNDPSSGESFLQEGDILAFAGPNGRILNSWGPADATSISILFQKSQNGATSTDPLSSQMVPAEIQTGGSQEGYLLLVVPFLGEHRLAGYFLIGTPVDPNNQLPRLLFSLLLGSLLMLAIALLGGFWLADRAIHPVKRITAAARSISETDLSLRLHLEQEDELGELADTFDDMLARLQAAFERQRQFTADASHELRTPLTIVELETSRALAARRSMKEYEQALQIIQSENQFMIRLVNNLLTLARMDAGQVTLQKEVLDLSDVALEVVERLAPIAIKAGVRLSTGDLPELYVRGDRQYLAQMISNLVENGIKYAGGDQPRVEVETGWRVSNHGNEAWVLVSDNGPGIPPEDLPHLFDRFYQVDKARTQQNADEESLGEQAPSGAGLGLSIAQWIAQAHGGKIAAQSELEKGSAFEVTLPLSKAPSATPIKTTIPTLP